MIEAFPLCWPQGWRSLGDFKYRDPSRFSIKSVAAVRDGLLHEVELLSGMNIVLSSNAPLRKDGLPYANFAQPSNPGVAIYFTLNKKQMVLACDQYPKVEENMHSLRKTIEAIRGIKRWGASDILERAFTGFQQLPSPQSNNWWEVLGVNESAEKEDIKRAWKNKMKENHPDIGGSTDMCSRINQAYEASKAHN